MRWSIVFFACVASACLSPPERDDPADAPGDGGSPGHDDGGGGGGDADGGVDLGPCPTTPLDDLVDPFDDLGPVWEVIGASPSCTVTASAGALRVVSDGTSMCGVRTVDAHPFTDQAVSIAMASDNGNMEGKPDIALVVYLANWTFEAQYETNTRLTHNCPNGTNCGTVSANVALPPYWRIRHDAGSGEVLFGFSGVGGVYDETGYDTGAITACAKVFIGSLGTTTGAANTAFDGVNIDAAE